MSEANDSPKNEVSPSVYATLIANLEMGVLVANDAALYLDANPAACRLFGRRRDQVVGHSLYDFVAPGRRADVEVQWAAFLRDSRQDGIFPITGLDGVDRWMAFHAEANFAPGMHVSFLTPALAPLSLDGATTAPITVCAWTKDVKVQGKWVTLEAYLAWRENSAISHGMSPRAFAAMSNRSVAVPQANKEG
jgi:PAS domain S-box-containing protein